MFVEWSWDEDEIIYCSFLNKLKFGKIKTVLWVKRVRFDSRESWFSIQKKIVQIRTHDNDEWRQTLFCFRALKRKQSDNLMTSSARNLESSIANSPKGGRWESTDSGLASGGANSDPLMVRCTGTDSPLPGLLMLIVCTQFACKQQRNTMNMGRK